MRWDVKNITFCYDRPDDYVDHLNQDLTPEHAQSKRDYISKSWKEKEIAQGLIEKDGAAAS